MIHEADLWTDDETFAKSAVGSVLSDDFPDLRCVSVHPEKLPDIDQPKPEPRNVERKNSVGKSFEPPQFDVVQDPPPPPIPGKVRWRLHYEKKP